METSHVPWLYNLRSSETFIIIVVSIAIFTDVFIYGMIVPIVPIALVERAGARPEDAQSWISILLAVYGATLLVGSPLFGYFADRCRLRRLPFIVGLVALGASTGLFVVARSLAVLIIARGLQGLSGAAVWVVGLAIVADNVPPERVGEAMGHTTIALTWGFVLGPTIGGVMYEKLGFYGTFSIPASLIVVDVVLRFAMIEESGAIQPDKSGLCSPAGEHQNHPYGTFAAREDEYSGYFSSGEDTASEEASLIRASSPCFEHARMTNEKTATILDLLQSPRLPLALAATVVMAVNFSALETTLPLFVMETFNWSSSGAGLIFVASSVPSFAGVYIGKCIRHTGAGTPGAFAFAVAACAWVLMRLVKNNTTADIALLVALVLVQGLSIVIVEVVAMTEVSQAVTDYEAEFPGAFGDKSPVAQAYALFNMAFAGGQLLGPILAGGMRVWAGWGTMTLILGLLCGMIAIPLGVFSEAPLRTQENAWEDGV
ncbi:uncharacterized protein N7482_008756 [Penicillium canariense]|uniref:Major facilitator superfamily (MFS) profile domain-containing protein n=1 Tax=Penicillium canariense TaxID=189055 RepID=A0A9W9HX76_9EURO|nr:uncharacterized protein N7482_008756 [Penicillium canariense]KAJ5157656.1 hypothetical protein N7482_008756 [Penicillium canariense]